MNLLLVDEAGGGGREEGDMLLVVVVVVSHTSLTQQPSVQDRRLGLSRLSLSLSLSSISTSNGVVRSPLSWWMEGEDSSKFFCSIEYYTTSHRVE